MFGDLFGKLQEAQQNMQEVKDRLETVSVLGDSADGKVKVIASGNRRIKQITIDSDLLAADPEELEDHLVIAVNRALEKAENTYQTEIKSATGDLLPPHLMQMMNQGK
jgi:DNA-binding YbaB/EbfC family protein